MARNNPKPTEKPDWIPDDTTNIVAPSAGRKLSGWTYLVKPPAQNFNWLSNLLSRFVDFFSAQAEDWIVIDSDADEGDYSTLAAYLADAPAAGDRVLIKEDQTITVQMIIPANVTLKFLDGARLLCATNIATSVLQLNSNVIIEGVLNVVLSHTGTTAKAVEYNGDNATGKINVENSSTGTLTTAHHINANKTGNQVTGFVDNTGGGVLTNVYVDNSTEDSNKLEIVDGVNNQVRRSRGAYKFRDGLEFDLGSDANGDTYYRNSSILQRLPIGIDGDSFSIISGVPIWQRPVISYALQIGSDLNFAGGVGNPALASMTSNIVAMVDDINENLTAYQHDGNVFSQLGNPFALGLLSITSYPAITRLNDTDIAYFDGDNETLRVYRHDGTDFAQVGNALSIVGGAQVALAGLSSTRIAFYSAGLQVLRTYDFDGTDFTLTGNSLSLTGVGSPGLARMGPLRVALVGGLADYLRAYDFDETDWSLTGNSFSIAGAFAPRITSINSTDIAMVDQALGDMRYYRFDETDWGKQGNSLTIAAIAAPTVAFLENKDVAFIDSGNDDMRIYRWL